VTPRETADRRIRHRRAPKPFVDPWKAHGSIIESERRPDGRLERTLTIFLSGAECPFTCSFCDLWRYTIDGPTPTGALPKQIADTLATLEPPLPDRIKLYNASNFFDKRAVPPVDVPRIGEQCASFAGVTVESHANTIGASTLEFARTLAANGSGLEIAMGLETIHPDGRAHLNKRLDLERFDAAAELLVANDIALRVFVLLGAPYVPEDESMEWVVRAVDYARQRGASLVSIIPMRAGNGEMERLAELGHFTPPKLADIEAVLDRCVAWSDVAITVDLWDIERFVWCDACRARRVERLHRMNLSGRAEPAIMCDVCAPSLVAIR